MNPDHPSFELPTQPLPGQSGESPQQNAAETPAAAPEAAGMTAPQVTGSLLTPLPPEPPAPVLSPTGTIPQPSAGGSVPLTADDVDVIEREWVLKAKAIVARTKNDPYEESRELGQFKAEYLKKRYNKDIKVAP